MPQAGEMDEPPDPLDIRLLGPVAVVSAPDCIAQLLEQPRACGRRRWRSILAVHPPPPKVELLRTSMGRNVLTQREDDRRGYILVGLQTDKSVN